MHSCVRAESVSLSQHSGFCGENKPWWRKLTWMLESTVHSCLTSTSEPFFTVVFLLFSSLNLPKSDIKRHIVCEESVSRQNPHLNTGHIRKYSRSLNHLWSRDNNSGQKCQHLFDSFTCTEAKEESQTQLRTWDGPASGHKETSPWLQLRCLMWFHSELPEWRANF